MRRVLAYPARSLNFANEQNAQFCEAVVQIQDKKLEHIFRHPDHRPFRIAIIAGVRSARKARFEGAAAKEPPSNISFHVSSTLVSAREMITGAAPRLPRIFLNHRREKHAPFRFIINDVSVTVSVYLNAIKQSNEGRSKVNFISR